MVAKGIGREEGIDRIRSLTVVFDDNVTRRADDIAVVAKLPDHEIIAARTVQDVVMCVADEGVVQAVTGSVQRTTLQLQPFDVVAQRIVRQVGIDRIRSLAVVFDDNVTRRANIVSVVAKLPDHVVIAGSAAQNVVMRVADEGVVQAVTRSVQRTTLQLKPFDVVGQSVGR